MKKQKYFYITVTLFICLHYKMFANYFITVDNVRKSINSVKINEIDFVDYEQLFKIFVPKIQSNKNNFLLNYNNFSVLANSQNFFILVNSDTTENILQLSTPPIIRNNKLFVPVQSLINSLNYFLNFRYDFVRNGVFIETNDNFLNFFEPVFLIEKEIFDEYFEEFFDEKIIVEVETNESISEEKIETVNNNLLSNFQNEIKLEQTVIKKADLASLQIPIYENLIEYEAVAVNETVSEIRHSEELIIRTIIEKPQIANLGFEREMINNIFFQDEQEGNFNIFQKNDVSPKDIEVNNSTFINQALPPFRKYSIPVILKKRKLEELIHP